jgi:hypothetical protein
MANGIGINVFLKESSLSGLIKCEIGSWNGVVYKIPRNKLREYKDEIDVKRSGVYLLLGKSESDGKDQVYVGQAKTREIKEGILGRLKEHDKTKDWWNEALAFTRVQTALDDADLSYLERKLYKIAREAQRFNIDNGNEPSDGNPDDSKKSTLDIFVDHVKLIAGVLGYHVFEKLNEDYSDSQNNVDKSILYIKRKKGDGTYSEARCKNTGEGFVLLKGSEINERSAVKIPAELQKLREKEVTPGGKLKKDILFSTPSAAATFVTGTSCNGNITWKNKDGKTLQKIKEEE